MKIKKFIKKHKYVLSFCLLLVCFSLFMSLMFHKESDYFWHVKAGEVMFLNKNILTKDVFSWFLKGSYWVSHEWAFDMLIFLLLNIFGKVHLFIYTFVATLGLLLILFFTNKKDYLKNTIFSMLWLVGFLIFCVYMQARPHLLSFSFLALTIYFLYDLYKNAESRKIFWLPLVSLFWANFHGGSSNLSYLFCFIFVVVGAFKFDFTKIWAKRISKKQVKKYLIVAFLCIIAICFNPHGVRMLVYPYINIFDTVMINFISEWQPTVLSNPSHYPYFAFIIIIMLVMLFSKKKIEFIDFCLFGVSVVLGLKSIRFWGYTYLIMSYVIFKYIESRKVDKGTCGCLLLLSAIFFGIFITNRSTLIQEYDKRVLSKELISTIKKENPSRLYNMYDYGGELIYNDIFVFVDGRADLYSRNNLKDYSDISFLQGDYIKTIDKYNFDYFLVDSKYPIATYLSYSDEYTEIYREKSIILYKKDLTDN